MTKKADTDIWTRTSEPPNWLEQRGPNVRPNPQCDDDVWAHGPGPYNPRRDLGPNVRSDKPIPAATDKPFPAPAELPSTSKRSAA
jgi:hypothetical protein